MQVTVPGNPVAKPRPRVSKLGIMYTPNKSRNYEEKVAEVTSETIHEPLEGPVHISIKFLIHRPKSFREGPAILMNKRPDIDNLIKSILDGLCSIAFLDDSQVVSISAIKYYHAYNEEPRTIINIKTMEDTETFINP